jgi:tRNA uridine 5-carboxymethylaminomethyl modification enzyme
LAALPEEVRAEIELEAKYSGFIERQEREAMRLRRYSGKRIPPGLSAQVSGLSGEARDKLEKYAPSTIGRALEIGVSPQDALILLAHMKNWGAKRGSDRDGE